MVLAPMQLIQVLAGAGERIACLRSAPPPPARRADRWRSRSSTACPTS